jgi:hypothetical protein
MTHAAESVSGTTYSDDRLAGNIAVVTGAARDIGLEIARR